MMSKMRLPPLNWLRVFEAAARHESFAGAARELNMSAPGVSQQIRGLETHLGRPLFERHAHRVGLTSEGRAFFPSVQNALRSVELSTNTIFGATTQTIVTVQAILIFALYWLAPRLDEFETTHPGIRIQLATGNEPEDFYRSLPDFRIVFGSGPWLLQEADLLFGERLYPVAVPRLAAQIQSAPDLLEHPLIEIATHRAGWAQYFEGTGSQMLDVTDLTYVDNTAVAFALAGAGNSIALARQPVTDIALEKSGLARCLSNSIEGRDTYHLVHDGAETLTPAARAFRSWLSDAATKEQARLHG